MPRTRALSLPRRISPGAVIELLKPVTWFAPMWAFACGSVASSVPGQAFPWITMLAGMVLAGPLVCGASQAANDWFDRHVDAINEPDRPIPSGRMPGSSGLVVALLMSALALLYAWAMSPLVLAAAALALAIGWAYSAPPFRFKADGWTGAAACAFSYEGLSWLTGALAIAGGAALGRPMLVAFALLYAAGAHGIMTLNDFKAETGDRASGIRSLPVRLGVRRAALVACWVMAVPQAVVIALLAMHATPIRACVITILLLIQLVLMRRLVTDPAKLAPWYNGTGVTLYVAGMMIAAFAVRAA